MGEATKKLPNWFSISVTRWLNYLFNIWPFTAMKVCTISKKICQNIFKVQKNLKIAKDISKFAHSSKISPNLVTLFAMYVTMLEYSHIEHVWNWDSNTQLNNCRTSAVTTTTTTMVEYILLINSAEAGVFYLSWNMT